MSDETLSVHRSIVGEFEVSTTVTPSYFETRVFIKDVNSPEEVPEILLDRVEAHLSRVMSTRADIQRYGVTDMATRTMSFETARDVHDIVTASARAFISEFERVITYVRRTDDDDEY